MSKGAIIFSGQCGKKRNELLDSCGRLIMAENMTEFNDLPENVRNFIKLVIKKVRYHKKVRADVFRELVSHFVDELADIADAEQRQQVAEEIIAGFGEPEVLGKLIRRGKKRCRPLWKKVLIAGFQIGCVLVLLIGLRVSTFYVGKPVVKIDYGKWLTEKASAGKDPKLNAKIDIDRAIELVDFELEGVLPFAIYRMWPGDLNEVEVQLTQKHLADNAQAIQALRDAADKPYFWMNYDNPQFAEVSLYDSFFLQNPKTLNRFIGVLAKWRRLANIMKLNIRFEVYKGQVDQAVDDCMAGLKLANFNQRQAFFIEQLVGIAIEGMFNHTLKEILSRVEILPSKLLAIQQYCEKTIKENQRVIDFTGEKVIRLDEIQRGFTDDGKGDGRVLAKGLKFLFENKSNFVKGFLLGGYPGKKETIDELERFFNQADSFFEQTPFQHNEQQLELKGKLIVVNGFADFGRTASISWRFRSSRLALVTVIAIKRYELETGRLPVSLEQVVEAGYLDEVPMDPFGDGALGYKVVDDDFVLYSVGKDFEDDGGKVEYLNNGRVNQFKVKGGDYIFWPVREKAE